MLKIGEFSKLSRVSIRMLRYYDEIGLLKPAHVDSFTEYRYYSEEQLPVLCRITALKDMGFALSDITLMLRVYNDRGALNTCLLERRHELEQTLADTQKKLAILDAFEKRLREEENMNYNVTAKIIPSRYAATVHMTLPTYEDEGLAWKVLCDETDSMNLIPDEPCLCAATFLDSEYKEENVEVEISKSVKGRYPDTEHVRFQTLPEVRVASCVFKGGYEQMSEVYGTILGWIQANGCRPAGCMFNIYHISPYETQNPDEFVTEVCCPIE